jgi:hypothetical protein
MMSQRSYMFWSLFFYSCMNVLIHLPSLQALIFCLLLGPVYWWGFQLRFSLGSLNSSSPKFLF